MASTASAAAGPGPATVGPWLWGRGTDLAVFGGAAAASLALWALAPILGDAGGGLPTWGWLVFVVAVDVAHVWTTIFRTYLDRAELARHRVLYVALPLACWAAGVALHSVAPIWFWRALAYLAVFHFVRQQVGWVAIYRARAGERGRFDRLLDDATIYAATGWPLLHWHAHLPRAFRWFVEGDFVALPPALVRLVEPGRVVYVTLLVVYALRSAVLARRALGEGRATNWGKHLVVGATALLWWLGIVATDGDFAFTVTNVVFHGVPYMALLWFYARERSREVPRSAVGAVVRGGVVAFLAVVVALALAEEAAWDLLVWHDHTFLFGGERDAPLLGPLARAFVVPLLALPQATHYVLDALLWRRPATGSAQARALGFARAPRADGAEVG